jgi:hypothetical protein
MINDSVLPPHHPSRDASRLFQTKHIEHGAVRTRPNSQISTPVIATFRLLPPSTLPSPTRVPTGHSQVECTPVRIQPSFAPPLSRVAEMARRENWASQLFLEQDFRRACCWHYRYCDPRGLRSAVRPSKFPLFLPVRPSQLPRRP